MLHIKANEAHQAKFAAGGEVTVFGSRGAQHCPSEGGGLTYTGVQPLGCGHPESVICPLTLLARLHPCGQVCGGLTGRCWASLHTKESGTQVSGNGCSQMVPIHWGRRTQTRWSQFNFGGCIFSHYLMLDYMHHLSQLCLDKSLMQNTAEACWIFKLCPLLSNQPQRRQRGRRGSVQQQQQRVALWWNDNVLFVKVEQDKVHTGNETSPRVKRRKI